MSEESPNPPKETPAEGVPTVRLPQQAPAQRAARSGWAVGITGMLALFLFGIAGLSLLLMRPGQPAPLAQVGTTVPTFTAQTTPTSAPPTATNAPTHTPLPSATPTTLPQHTQPTPTPVPTQVPTPAPTTTPRGTPTPVPTPSCSAPGIHYGATTPIRGDAGESGVGTTIGSMTLELRIQQKPDGQGGCIPTDVQEISIITLMNTPETSGSACMAPSDACYVQGTVSQTDTTSGKSTSWMKQHVITSGPFSGSLQGGDDASPEQGSGQQCVSGQAFYLDNFGQQHDAAPTPQYCWNQ